MKRIVKFLISLALALSLASFAVAQESRVYQDHGNWVVESKGELSAAKNLHVKLSSGSVKVQGGSQSGFTYVVHRKAYTSSEQQARREFDSYKISASVRGDTAWIAAESQSGWERSCSDDFVITVPQNLLSAKIETGGGSVEASGIAGRVEIETAGGTIHLDGIGGDVSAKTGGGAIDVGNVQGGVVLETGGGSIKIGSAKGQIKAESGGGSLVVLSGLQGAVLETGAGSIRVEKCAGSVKATTGGGSVELGQIGGPAEIETGAGSIRLASANGRVHAETGGGSIQLDGATSVQAETSAGGIVVKLFPSASGAPDGHSNSTLETSAGDITVYLAANLAISVRAEIEAANGHTIHSDFSDIRVSSEGGQWGPKTVTAEGQLNGGGPTLKVRTNSGNVTFRRASH